MDRLAFDNDCFLAGDGRPASHGAVAGLFNLLARSLLPFSPLLVANLMPNWFVVPCLSVVGVMLSDHLCCFD